MKPRIKPGDVCVVIAEDPTCRCNVGALLTVTVPNPEPEPDDPRGWLFKGASRPLKMIYAHTAPVWVTQSHYHDDGPEPDVYYWMPEAFLIPVKGDDEPEVETTDQPMETTA